MRWLASLRLRLRSVFRSSRVDEELTRELLFHLDREIDANIAAGMTPEDAKHAAIRSIGGLARVQEECRDARGVSLVDDLRQDVRYALRSLARNPGFSAVAILTLALGIGANTAIFSVINAVLLRPLPLPDADRLVTIVENRPASAPFDGRPARRPPFQGDIRELRSSVHSLDAVFLYGGAPDIHLPGREEAPPLRGARLSPDAMAFFGAHAALGRLPKPDESNVVVLSTDAWRRYFNGDRAVIGRTLSTTVGNVPSQLATDVYTVIGVAAPGFAFPDAGVDYWLAGTGPQNVARLRAGVSLPAAAQEVSSALYRIVGTTPAAPPTSPLGPPRFELVPLQEQIVGHMRATLQLIGVAVGLVLLIACANVANLLLARSTARVREMAVRAALGAGRGRLMRQALTESVLLAGIGSLIGTALAYGSIGVLRSLFASFTAPPMLRQIGAAAGPATFPRLAEIHLDARTLLVTAVVCVTAGVLFGLTPALRQLGGLSVGALREGTVPAGSGLMLFRRHALRSTLVVVQVSLAMTLLVAGGLIVRSLYELLTVNKGFNAENALVFQVHSAEGHRSVPELRAFAERVTARFERTPGILSAAYAQDMPLIGPAQSTPLLLAPNERVPSAGRPHATPYTPALRLVSRDFFSVAGTKIIAGRGFRMSDRRSPIEMVINQTLARARFPGASPVGRRVYLGRGDVANEPLEIVGVAEDMRQAGLDVDPDPQMFVDFAAWPGTQQAFDEPNYYAVRTAGDPRLIVPQIRSVVAQVAPGATVEQVLTLDDIVSTSVARPRAYAVLLGLFSVVGLLLAAIGVYGVMTYAVAQSTRELGVRLALGAQRREILRFVLGRAGIMASTGIALGIVGALVVTRYLRTMLFDLSPLDPLTFVASAVLFVIVAMIASYVPARRAMDVDPLVALRYE